MLECVVAPPSVSASTTWPTAALTNAGAAKNILAPSVIIYLSHITGRYSPPATHGPITGNLRDTQS